MIFTILKYTDMFGTECTFYTDRQRKYYSVFGGILTQITILFCIFCFLCVNIDDLKRKNPIISSSGFYFEGNQKIKPEEKKIWIPWRIIHSNDILLNNNKLIFPVINHYYGERKNFNESFELKNKMINYKLCNETSMINKTNNIYINVPLDKLYCIEMDDIELGGSWNSLIINSIELNFYLCENGINYDENNTKCTTNEKLTENLGEYLSLDIEIFVPIVQYQPTNLKTPILIIYKSIYYSISKYTNKISRLFLQEYVLSDDLGWVNKNIKNFSYWGLSSLNDDFYVTLKDDINKKKSTSKLYTIYIYLESGIMLYERSYKKLFNIFIDNFPLFYFLFFIFKNLAKVFKHAEEKKKMFELLFENLVEKKSKFPDFLNKIKITNNIIKEKKNIVDGSSYNNINNQPKNYEILNQNLNDIIINESSIKYSNCSILDKNNKNFISSQSCGGRELDNNSNNKSQKNVNPITPKNINRVKFSLFQYQKKFSSNHCLSQNADLPNLQKKEIIFKPNKKYITLSLFPFKYYLISVFCKNFKEKNFKECFSKNYIKFMKINIFIGQLLDISSYITLQKEFQKIKYELLNKKNIGFVENDEKLNINGQHFMRNINECIDSRKNMNVFKKNLKRD